MPQSFHQEAISSRKSVEHFGFRIIDCEMMWTRRLFLIGLGTLLLGWNFVSNVWAKAKQLLPKGFPKNQLLNMNPEEIDNRNLEVDPLDKFGTMGPIDVEID